MKAISARPLLTVLAAATLATLIACGGGGGGGTTTGSTGTNATGTTAGGGQRITFGNFSRMQNTSLRVNGVIRADYVNPTETFAFNVNRDPQAWEMLNSDTRAVLRNNTFTPTTENVAFALGNDARFRSFVAPLPKSAGTRVYVVWGDARVPRVDLRIGTATSTIETASPVKTLDLSSGSQLNFSAEIPGTDPNVAGQAFKLYFLRPGTTELVVGYQLGRPLRDGERAVIVMHQTGRISYGAYIYNTND